MPGEQQAAAGQRAAGQRPVHHGYRRQGHPARHGHADDLVEAAALPPALVEAREQAREQGYDADQQE